jgi:IS30 family transposase
MNEIIDIEVLNKKDYLTIGEISKSLNCSENTIYRYVRRGWFQPIKFKNKNYFRTEEVLNHIQKVFTVDTISS